MSGSQGAWGSQAILQPWPEPPGAPRLPVLRGLVLAFPPTEARGRVALKSKPYCSWCCLGPAVAAQGWGCGGRGVKPPNTDSGGPAPETLPTTLIFPPTPQFLALEFQGLPRASVQCPRPPSSDLFEKATVPHLGEAPGRGTPAAPTPSPQPRLIGCWWRGLLGLFGPFPGAFHRQTDASSTAANG